MDRQSGPTGCFNRLPAAPQSWWRQYQAVGQTAQGDIACGDVARRVSHRRSVPPARGTVEAADPADPSSPGQRHVTNPAVRAG
jgi:hypothetical protein